MFTMVFVCFVILLQEGISTGEDHELGMPWTIEKPGDIMIHGILPLHVKRPVHRGSAVLNFEELIWMGAVIHRILEINRAGILPGNVTLGYSMRDSACDGGRGLKQSLEAVNKIINSKSRREFHIPAVLSPTCDAVEYNSYKLFDMFGLPRVSYTTTSNRFPNTGGLLRTVPSDLIHVEALVRVLEDMNADELTILASRKNPWLQRANVFERVIKFRQRIPLSSVIYFDTVNNVSNILKDSKMIVVFAEASEIRLLMKRKPRDCTWVTVNKYDDPLFRIFDGTGKLSNKTIIRNTRTNNFESYKKYLIQLSQESEGKNWLGVFIDVFIHQCRNRSTSPDDCSRKMFERNISNYFTAIQKKYSSSLSLQGAVDAVDIVVNAVKNIFKNCARKTVKCLRSSSKKLKWLTFLRNTKLERDGRLLGFTENGVLRGNYSIQVLRRTVKSVFGRRMMVPKAWTFTKVREWNISGHLRIVYMTKNFTLMFAPTEPTRVVTDFIVAITDNDRISWHNITTECNYSCNSTVSVVEWSNGWMIGLYLAEIFILCGIIFTLVYFIKHKDSPIMILCCSWPDNVTLIVLCLITILPTMHIGVHSFTRCLILWPAVNVVFGLYIAFLLTKTLWVQNLLKCEVATDHPVRRMIFVLSVTTIHLLIITMSSIFGSLVDTRTACIPRGLLVVCDIKNSTGIIFSMALNCTLLIALVALSLRETLKQRKNFCRTENLIGVVTVVMVSYLCSIFIGYFNLVLKHYLVITLLHCVLYLINPVVCLVFIYVPTLRLVSTWLRQHIRQQKNLTSIKRAQVISAKRQSAGPIADSLLNTNFSPQQSLIPSRQSGYYFDFRPVSAATGFSYPNSLVRSVHEPTHVVFGYGRISANESAGFQTETSMEELEEISSAQSYESFYDNIASHSPTRKKTLREQLPAEIMNYYGRSCQDDDDVFVNKQCEESNTLRLGETNKWPSLEKLKASNI